MKIQFILLLLFSLSINCINAQTTLEEYNYLTKGFKIQQDAGLDMKKGYKLVDQKILSLREGNNVRKGTLKALFREKKETLELAAYLLVYQLNNEPPVYYCIPNPYSRSEVIKLYLDAMYDGNERTNNSYRLQLINYVCVQVMKWN